MKSCWVDWTHRTYLINCITFRLIRENSHLGYPHFSAKFIKIKVIFYFHEHAPVFGGPGFWEIMCGNCIHWSSDLLKTISHYMLLVFVVAQCWGPLWKSSFNLVIDEGNLSVSGDAQQCSKYVYIIHHGLFCLHAQSHYTTLGNMNNWNVDIEQRPNHIISWQFEIV